MSQMDELLGLAEALREAFVALRGLSARLLEDLACTAAERGVLAELDRHGARTVPALARRRSITRQAMQKTIDVMIARGWLRTVPNPEHARSSLIALTPAGARLWGTIHGREARVLAARALPVSARELAEATAVLTRLKPFLEALP